MASLVGIGTCVPVHSISQARALEMAKEYSGYSGDDLLSGRALEKLYRKTHIRSRSTVLQLSRAESEADSDLFYRLPSTTYDTGPSTAERMQRYGAEVLPLALKAADNALEDAGLARESVAQLVTVSCTGFAAPGFDIGLVQGLQLSNSVGRSHLGFMGCHGALNALRVASSLCHSGNAPVLVCAAEICSLHFQYGSRLSNLVANALFSDGAAALVLAPSAGAGWWRHVSSGSFIVPDSLDAMTWTIGDSGFLMTLSSQLPDLIAKVLPDWLSQWLGKFGLVLSDIKAWAVHPGGPRILDAVEDSLSLSESDLAESRNVLSQYGNMSSPTILFILDRLRTRSVESPCVALAFGPGLTIEAALLA